MKRMYIEAFVGLIALFFATLLGYELIVYEFNTDYDYVLEEYQAEAMHTLMMPTYLNQGEEAAVNKVQHYADKTSMILSRYQRAELPAEIGQAFAADPQRMVKFDDDRNIWFRFDEHSYFYSLFPDEESPLRKAIAFDDNLLWVFFLGGFALYCVLLIWFLSRRSRALERTTLAFASGDLTARADTSSARSVGSLNKSFNLMADKISTLITSNKLLTDAVAHELRTPLFRLQWQADLLADTPLIPEQRDAVNSIVEDIDEMSELVEELLYYAKMERTDMPIQAQDVDVQQWLAPLMQRWQGETDKQLTLEVTALVGTARLDPHLLRRALDNLARNAMRYADQHIMLKVEREQETLRLEVHDDGQGIDPKEWPYLFDAFYSADKARNKATSGHGLGLAIVRQIALLHDGAVEVGDSPLGGACFTILI